MLLSGRPTPGAANIAAWVNTQVHFLSLSPTKVQTRINGIKERREPLLKRKTSHLGRGEMAGGYPASQGRWWRGVDVRANTTKNTE